jgi:SAM-dependent methyltransferase
LVQGPAMDFRFKPLYKAQKKLRRRVVEGMEAIYYRLNLAKAVLQSKQTLKVQDTKYGSYLRDQLEETLRKKRLMGRSAIESFPLIDELVQRCDVKGKSVLCVGCRNIDEILIFRKLGAGRVVGIDLYSDVPDILVMDMHDLKFADASFDIVYSRHSFEHAFDKAKAGREFVRVLRDNGVVAVEVPGKYKGGADYNLFSGIDDVLVAFQPFVGEALRNDYSRKEDNPHGMDIIQVIFRVDKAKGYSSARQPATG